MSGTGASGSSVFRRSTHVLQVRIGRPTIYGRRKLLKIMVGTTGFEPATSSVSSSLGYVLSTTYRSLETAKQRPRTPKPKIQPVILQARE